MRNGKSCALPPCRLLLPSASALCSCRLFLPPAFAACPCRLLLPPAPALCSCRLLLPSAPAACSCRLLLPSLPLTRFLQFPDFAFYQLTFEGTHLFKKHDAIAVIGFVQHAAGGKFRIVEFKLISIYVVSAHDCPQATLDRRKNTRKGKTTLFAVLFTFDVHDFRINHHYALVGIFPSGAVHHKQPPSHANLHRRQSYARRRIHRLKHIADEFFQSLVKPGNRITRRIKYRMRPLYDFH